MVMAHICRECCREFKTAAGLASHRRACHGLAAAWGPNRKALEVTLGELQRAGRIEPIDAAHVQAARSLADAVDKDDGNAYLWRTYREAVEGLVKSDDDGDTFEKLVAEINSRAPMGNSPQT